MGHSVATTTLDFSLVVKMQYFLSDLSKPELFIVEILDFFLFEKLLLLLLDEEPDV